MTSLKEEGGEVPRGVEVRIVEDTDTVHYLVLPMKRDTVEQIATTFIGGVRLAPI